MPDVDAGGSPAPRPGFLLVRIGYQSAHRSVAESDSARGARARFEVSLEARVGGSPKAWRAVGLAA